MRECNRPGGPHLLLTTDAAGARRYEINTNKNKNILKQFNLISADVGPADAPKRNDKMMQKTIDEMKKEMNAKAFDFVPYKWESLRSNPGK